MPNCALASEQTPSTEAFRLTFKLKRPLLAIIQARLSSRRLPGKVLMPLQGRPLLGWTIHRLQQSRQLTDILIATSSEPADDPIAAYARQIDIAIQRGPLADVASRFCQALAAKQAPAFVRICADSPFIDAALVDQAINHFHAAPLDLVTNVLPRSFPKGQSVEVICTETFRALWNQPRSVQEREHITQVYYSAPERFRIRNFSSKTNHAAIQLSVDTPEDFTRAQQLLQASGGQPGDWQTLVELHHRLTP